MRAIECSGAASLAPADQLEKLHARVAGVAEGASITDVFITEFCFSTPRIIMHMWRPR